MDNRKLILHYSDNYADEFDVEGYQAITKSQYDRIMMYMESYFITNRVYEWYFGSNEYICYQNYKDFFNAFSTTLISEDEYDTLMRLGLGGHGTSPIDNLLDKIYDEELDEF